MAKTKDKEPKELKPWEEISIGDQVKHPDWGNGTVLFRSGAGDSAKAIVVFPEEGQKKLMLKYAKLKKIGSAPKSEVLPKIKIEKPRVPVAPVEDDEKDEFLPDAAEAVGLPEDEEPAIFEDEDEERFNDMEEGGEE